MKRIYIAIENWKRESDSRIYFATKAAAKGFEVYFAKKSEMYSLLKYLESGIIILKSFGPMNSKIIDESKKRGHIILSWDEEIFISTDLEETINRRVYEDNLKKIEKFFLVGEREKDTIKKLFPSHKNKLLVTGHPRQEILKKNINKIFDKEANEIKKKYGNFILLVSSFNGMNQIVADNQIDRHFASLIKELPEATIESYKRRLNFERINLEFIIRFLKIFSKKYPQKKIIIRPHPAERINIWENICKDLKNVECIFDHIPTNSWMKASELSINSNCTTFFEAYMMNVNALNLFPAQGFEDLEFPILNEIADKVTNIDQLLRIIDNPQDHNFYKKNPNLKKYMSNFEIGKCSVDAIITEINSYKKNNILFKDMKINLFYLEIIHFFKNNILKKMKRKIFKLSSYELFLEKLSKQKVPKKINLNEINHKVEILKDVLKIQQKIKITKKFEMFFKFSLKN